MSHDDAPKKHKKHRIPKVLRRLAAALAVVLAFVAALLLSLPFALSSDFARAKIVQALGQATSRPASLERLGFRWSDGLRLEGLRIGRGGMADQGFLCSLERLHADVGLLSLLRGKAWLVMEIKGLRLRSEPGADTAPSPPEAAKPLPQLLREAFASLRANLGPRSLPLDATVLIDLSDSTVNLAGRPEPLELRDLSFRLDAPSIQTAPITCRASLDPVASGKSLGRVRLNAVCENLCDPAGRLAPAQARLTVDLAAPGLHAIVSGGIAAGLKADLRADLRECSEACGRLTPGLPALSGAVALGLTLTQTADSGLNASVLLFTDALHASGGPLGRKAFGPLSLSLLQEAAIDSAAETVQLPGRLDMAGRNQARWLGRLDGVREGTPRAAVTVAPLALDLAPFLAAARDFLPPGLGVGAASLTAEDIDLTVLLPESPEARPQLDADAKGLVLEAARILRRDPAGTLGLDRVRLLLESARASLPGATPGTLELKASARFDGVRLDGKTPVTVANAELRSLSVRAERLAQDKAALFGVSGSASVELDAEARGVEARSAKARAAVPVISKHVRLRAELPADRFLTASLDAMEVDAPLLRVLLPGKPPVEAPLALRLTAPDIRLSRPAEAAPLAPAVRNALLGLDIGGALHCSARLSLSGPASRDVASDGTVTLDAGRLLALAAPFAPKQARAAGALSADWKLSATLPNPPAPNAKPQPQKLSKRLKELNFLHEAELVLALRDLSLDWPLAAKPGKAAETLRLRGLGTPKPLRAATRDGVRESSLSGSLAFGPLGDLPGLGALDRPLRGLVTITAAQQGARSAQMSEMLRLEGHDLELNLSLVLDKLDLLLDREDKPTAALEHLDATLGFRLAAALHSLPGRKGQAASLNGTGRVEAGADLRLAGGRSLSVSARLLSPGLDLSLGPDTAISGLKSALRFQRRFSLAPGLRCPGDLDAELTPLSVQVFDLFPAAPQPRQDARSLAELLAPDAPGAQNLGSLSLARARLKSGPLPLELRDIELKLDTASPLPGLRSFRAGLLGGSVLGSANVRKAAGRYSLDADLAFTGIDPGRLLPAKAPRDLGGQAETSGRVSLSVPLTPDPETLLQRLFLRADITKIGPRTLERMLYALDPDEQNETIVQQRRLMDIGYPRNLRVGIAYGNLSLSGAVEVKGFQLDLPPVDRLNIANLPIKGKLTGPLAAVPGLIEALDAVSGSVICRDPGAGNALRVVQSAASQGVSP